MNSGAPTTPSGPLSWKTIARLSLVATALIFLGLAAFSHWLSTPPKEVVEADAGFKRAKQIIDPEKLRAWALGEIAVPRGKRGPIEVPDYVKNLYSEPPENAWVSDGKDGACVEIQWGGGFFSWGICIGPTNMRLPDNEGDIVRAQWAPGIYYGREATSFKIQ